MFQRVFTRIKNTSLPAFPWRRWRDLPPEDSAYWDFSGDDNRSKKHAKFWAVVVGSAVAYLLYRNTRNSLLYGEKQWGNCTKAVVLIQPVGESEVHGEIWMKEYENKRGVHYGGKVFGLHDGYHGFYIHKTGNITKGPKYIGGHYNPFHQPHGSPRDSHHHVGDLGNWTSDRGFLYIDEHINIDISLNPKNERCIIGRTLAITEGADDFGYEHEKEKLSPQFKKEMKFGDPKKDEVVGLGVVGIDDA